jgi:hypothetical protein
MNQKFEQLKSYVKNLGFDIASENYDEEIILISDERRGIINLIIDIEDPIVIFEQLIGVIKKDETSTYKSLLKINRHLVHGAFVLDDEGERLLFRDTLQVENLDQNEVDGTISALSLGMSEYGHELLRICK